MARPLVILGAGGLAREVAWSLRGHISRGEVDLLGFAEQPGGRHLGQDLDGLPCRDIEFFRAGRDSLSAAIAIGSSVVRKQVFAEVDALGLAPYSCIDDAACLSSSVRVGAGSILLAGTVLTVDIVLGRSVLINPGCTVGHDVVLDDFVTLAPGVHIGGNVTVKRGASLGIGANIINGTPDRPLVIGDSAVVGAGACVVRDVPEGTTVVGVPAREIAKRPG